jgi:hypothetical protein
VPVSVRGLTFERWHALTEDMPGYARMALLDYAPADCEACWANLAWQSARETEFQRRDPLLYDEWPKRRTPHHGTATRTSTGTAHVELDTRDPLRSIPANQNLPALTGEVVLSSGRTRCPMPDHPDEHPSCKCYGTRWVCFSCGAQGGIIDLASEIYGLEPTGREYWQIRDRLVADLEGALDV